MKDCRRFYIDGKWVDPAEVHDFEVINPANEEPIAKISLGSTADVDRAVTAAKCAFESYSETSLDERVALLRRIVEVYQFCNLRKYGACRPGRKADSIRQRSH
jgi:aldehyde dehydrogenase (NAD+)